MRGVNPVVLWVTVDGREAFAATDVLGVVLAPAGRFAFATAVLGVVSAPAGRFTFAAIVVLGVEPIVDGRIAGDILGVDLNGSDGLATVVIISLLFKDRGCAQQHKFESETARRRK